MTGRSSTRRTGLCLLALLLSCLSSGVFVVGEPEPIPSELLYTKSFINNAENLVSQSAYLVFRDKFVSSLSYL